MLFWPATQPAQLDYERLRELALTGVLLVGPEAERFRRGGLAALIRRQSLSMPTLAPLSCYLLLRHLITQRGCTHGAGRQGDRGVPPGRPWMESRRPVCRAVAARALGAAEPACRLDELR